MIPINASLVGPPPPADTEGAPSIRWFAAIQGIKRKQDLAALAPKGCFISAEAVEHITASIKRNRFGTKRALSAHGVSADCCNKLAFVGLKASARYTQS